MKNLIDKMHGVEYTNIRTETDVENAEFWIWAACGDCCQFESPSECAALLRLNGQTWHVVMSHTDNTVWTFSDGARRLSVPANPSIIEFVKLATQ